MNRLKAAAAAAFVLVLACSLPARASGDQVTMETKWNQKTFSISTTGVTSATFDIGGFGAQGYKLVGSSYTQNGVDGTTYGAVAVAVSSTPNVVGSNYLAYSTNSFSLQISQTVKTPAPLGLGVHGNGNTTVTSTSTFNSPYPTANFFTVPVISTSAVINVPASVLWTDSFRANTVNPIFRLTSLNTGATYYLTVDYLVPEIQ